MINKIALYNMVNSEWWKEFKKMIRDRKIELAMRIIDNPEKVEHNEKIKIKAFEECIAIAENIVKKEIFQNQELQSLWNLPDSW